MATHRVSISLAVFALLGVALYVLVSFNEPISSRIKWALSSKSYEQKLSALPNASPGQLKHVEWDGWGWPGAGNTVVYLAYDPSNALRQAAISQRPGKYPGLPCDVYVVHEMQSDYYTVQFYTDTDWQQCTSSG